MQQAAGRHKTGGKDNTARQSQTARQSFKLFFSQNQGPVLLSSLERGLVLCGTRSRVRTGLVTLVTGSALRVIAVKDLVRQWALAPFIGVREVPPEGSMHAKQAPKGLTIPQVVTFM